LTSNSNFLFETLGPEWKKNASLLMFDYWYDAERSSSAEQPEPKNERAGCRQTLAPK
jgi:hypothetical protein